MSDSPADMVVLPEWVATLEKQLVALTPGEWSGEEFGGTYHVHIGDYGRPRRTASLRLPRAGEASASGSLEQDRRDGRFLADSPEAVRRLIRLLREEMAIVADLRELAGDVYLVVQSVHYEGDYPAAVFHSRAEAIRDAEARARDEGQEDTHYLVQLWRPGQSPAIVHDIAPAFERCLSCHGSGAVGERQTCEVCDGIGRLKA